MIDRQLRRDLLRLGRLDAALRSRWVRGGFTDRRVERKLEQLTAAGLACVREAIAERGWPGRAVVGARAADVACKLVQHAGGPLPFLRHCLRLIRRSAARGDVPSAQVAYVTDSLRLLAGRKQLYGTKFRVEAGALVPCPIERAASVDERRRLLGLEPLESYARRLRRRYPPPSAPGGRR